MPLKQWYYDTTSQWTLDYPPLFAYFECLLSQLAQYIDPGMLLVDNHNYASTMTIVFQRGSVIVSDLLYAASVWYLLHTLETTLGIRTLHYSAEAIHLFNVGLLFVDHIHFQYNGLLMGLFLLSINLLLNDHYLWATFTFAFLVNMKHIFLYVAPVIGLYLLLNYCSQYKNDQQSQNKWPWSWNNFAKLVVIGIIPFVISFAPFYRQLPQVISRLFPFGRGLTHAYWAPNFWALYNTADKMLAILLRVRKPSEYTSGLVQQYNHLVLPNVKPLMTFILTILAMLPVLRKMLVEYNSNQR